MAESTNGLFFVVGAITVAGVLVLMVGLLMPELMSGISSSMVELSGGDISGGESTTLEKQETYSKDDYGL